MRLPPLALATSVRVQDSLDTAEACIAAGKHIHLDKPAGRSQPFDSGDRMKLEALVMSGREAAERGQDDVCMQRLEEARALAKAFLRFHDLGDGLTHRGNLQQRPAPAHVDGGNGGNDGAQLPLGQAVAALQDIKAERTRRLAGPRRRCLPGA